MWNDVDFLYYGYNLIEFNAFHGKGKGLLVFIFRDVWQKHFCICEIFEIFNAPVAQLDRATVS